METNLRPLTLGEILDRTAQLYRTNFLLFAGIFSMYAGVGLVMNLIQLGITQWLKSAHLFPRLMWVTYSVAAVEWLLLLLLLGAAIAAISRAVASLHLGEPITIRDAYKSTLPRLGRYLWLMFLSGIRAWLPFVVLYAGLIVFILRYGGGFANTTPGTVGVAATPAQQQAVMMMGIAVIVFGLLSIPLGIYTIWMSVRYSLAVPACVVEDMKARAAIKRSIELSKGARWRILALGLLVAVIKVVLVLLTQSFVFIAAIRHPGQISVGMNIASQVIAFFTNSFLGPIGAAGVTLFYFDQRVRKEGYDIEWMMQAAGMTPAELISKAETGQAAETGQTAEAGPVEAPVDIAPDAAVDTTATPETEADAHAGSAHE